MNDLVAFAFKEFEEFLAEFYGFHYGILRLVKRCQTACLAEQAV